MKRSATVCFTVAVFQLMNDIAASSSTEMELVSEAFIRSTNQLPDGSTNADIAAYLSQYSDEQLKGVLANVKGIYHELIFTHAENYDEDSITAAIFEDTNHPGADLEFMVDGEVIGQVQLKAVMDKSLILEHFEKYPDIDVYATSEVASQLLDVKDSGFSNRDLHEDVAGFVAEIGVDDTIEKAGSGFVLGASMSAAISLADAIKKGKISRHAVRRAVKDGSLSAAVAAAVDFILS